MISRTKALLIDDDVRLARLVTEYLRSHEVDVSVAPDGTKGLAALHAGDFSVVILDVMMPGRDGFEVCRRIRANPVTAALPVIMLTARGEDVDRIVGLEMGADDYLPKPFNPRELLARVRALVRRSSGFDRTQTEVVRVGDLALDTGARVAIVAGRRVELTHHEFELLLALARASPRILTREQILEAANKGPSESFDRSVDVHIKNLRAKIEEDPHAPRRIKTARGVGYSLARSDAS